MNQRPRLIGRFILLVAILAHIANASAGDAPAEDLRQMAQTGVVDLLRHYWTGDEKSGHIANTWHGYTNSLPDARGALWERATLYLTLHNAEQCLRTPDLAARLKADWNRTKALYTSKELEACGQESHANWAVDDAGWSALMYLAAHRVTGDPYALLCARGLVSNSLNRWQDNQLGGGMWYNDAHKTKSLYQVSILLAALRVDELMRHTTLNHHALECYTWIEEHLLRPDGLYWCDYTRNGPAGAERPNDIREASSVVFLGGNMAMAVLHARLYRLTGNEDYRKRALRTANGILTKLVASNRVLLNDRDSWTNGLFSGEWAREVLSLKRINPEHVEVLKVTAASIFHNARTVDGFYGASWSGPAEGAGSIWFAKRSKPQQIMTSANSVNMIVAAAILKAPVATSP